MSLPDTSLSQEEAPLQFGTLENDNLTLAANSANISIDNAVRLVDAPSQMGSIYEQHVFKLLIAYSELDDLVKSVGVSREVAHHAKSLYSQVYNFSDFEGRWFPHDTLIAACVYISCCEKDQRRTMSEVFKSTHVTTQQMCSVCETLQQFFSSLPETRRLLSNADKRLLSAYEEIDSVSDSNSIPSNASNYARYLYERVHVLDSLKDQDKHLIVASSLCIACRQLNIPRTSQETLSMVPGATKAEIERTYKSLEVVFAAENRQYTLEEPEGTVMDTGEDAHSGEQIVQTLQELTDQLALDQPSDSASRRDAVLEPHSSPPAHAPASNGTNGTIKCKDAEMATCAAPDIAFAAYASHDSRNHDGDSDNAIGTPPPAAPATAGGLPERLRSAGCADVLAK